MKQKLLSLFLAFALLIGIMPQMHAAAATPGLSNFKTENKFTANLFTDVASSAWYVAGVQSAYEYNLMKGSSASKFNPTGNMTVAEALALASRIHSIYNTGSANFVQGSPWYQVYVDYATKNNLISSGEFSSYTVAATRAQFASVLSRVLPAAELKAINNIGTIPDVPSNAAYRNSVHLLYSAGILTGSDKYGSFRPTTTIQRCEVATIVTRMVDPKQRKQVVLETRPALTGIKLAGKTSIMVGTTTTWTASADPADAAFGKVTWTSGNPGVATVDANGKITALKAGQSNITAYYGSFKKTVLLTVTSPTPTLTGIKLAGKTSIMVGTSTTWTASADPAGALLGKVAWTSGNPGVATVDANGRITALKAGQSNITAYYGSFKKTVLLTVTSPTPTLTGIKLAGKTSIMVGTSTTWTASADPAGAAFGKVTWTSGNPGVATVDANGRITARKAGQAHISASYGSVKKTVLLTVTPLPTPQSVQLAGTTSIYVGAITKWTAKITPSNANQWVSWSSGNPSVATVDKNGNIKGLKAGQSNITATAANGVKKTALITVSNRPTANSAKIDTSAVDSSKISTSYRRTITMEVGETIRLNKIASPSGSNSSHIIWGYTTGYEKFISVNEGQNDSYTEITARELTGSKTIYVSLMKQDDFSYEYDEIEIEIVKPAPKIVLRTAIPKTLHEYNYNKSIESSYIITNFKYTCTSSYDGTFRAEIHFGGTKIYDRQGSGHSSSCEIGWKLYDSSGYVIDSGTCYSTGLAMGEKFKDENDYIYYLESGETYYLEILNSSAT
ncbi:MAG: Ig-like domain-containing protein [Oscillospiraceae bacterium]|nr:Ig-like domain-containing protein [Oscillospiraceae bacterium]